MVQILFQAKMLKGQQYLDKFYVIMTHVHSQIHFGPKIKRIKAYLESLRDRDTCQVHVRNI